MLAIVITFAVPILSAGNDQRNPIEFQLNFCLILIYFLQVLLRDDRQITYEYLSHRMFRTVEASGYFSSITIFLHTKRFLKEQNRSELSPAKISI